MKKPLLTLSALIYLMLLTWLILFKANPGTLDVLFDPDYRSLSLIPAFNSKETLLNIAAFMPLGLFAYLLLDRLPFSLQTALIFWLSLIYEAAQYILCIGTTDITDLLGNTLGGVLGLLFCRLTPRLVGSKSGAMLNALSYLSVVLLAALTYLLY